MRRCVAGLGIGSRRMEIYSSTTRFALACNLSEKIIEPIQSRCAVLRYSKLTDQQARAPRPWAGAGWASACETRVLAQGNLFLALALPDLT